MPAGVELLAATRARETLRYSSQDDWTDAIRSLAWSSPNPALRGIDSMRLHPLETAHSGEARLWRESPMFLLL